MSKDKFIKRFQVFGVNMRIARKSVGLTSAKLARLLGISTAYVGLIERGERTPSVKTMLEICDFFGKSVEEMMAPTKYRPRPKPSANKGESTVSFNDDYDHVYAMPPE